MTDKEPLKPAETHKEKLRRFYRHLCLNFAGTLRALSLYPADHPETAKKIGDFFARLEKYLSQRPTLSILFLSGELVVENVRLPEAGKALAQLLNRFETMNLQRLMFRRGLTQDELVFFLTLLLPLLKDPSNAELVLAKNQQKLPHILAGRVPFDLGPQVSYKELASALQTARQSVSTFSTQIKDLFSALEGPLPKAKVSLAKETTKNLQHMILSEEIPLKTILYRRSPDPDLYVHAINVSALSMALARQLNLEKGAVQDIGLGALLHDIGLYAAPAASMSTTAAISLDEKKRRWEHPIRGAEILLASPAIPDLVPIVAYEHHLHYSGGGYPEQKRRRELNLASMITSVANTYDNLRRNRPEQGALSMAQALNWMDKRQNKEFHPLVLKQFRALVKSQASRDA
jgi:putative nucleotidyltransferase with HDIG domain